MFSRHLYCSALVVILALSLMLTMTFPAGATTGEWGMVKQFVVSPNGERIIFVSETFLGDCSPANGAGFMLFDFNTMDVVGLTGKIREAVLSPDAKFIAYAEDDRYYGVSLSLLTADGRERRVHYHHPNHGFSQLKWSKDSRYLMFVTDGINYKRRTIVISPQIGVAPDELPKVEWQEAKQPPADHPLYQKKPTAKVDSSMLWGDDRTVYVQAADGIWKGELDVPFTIRWTQLVAAEDTQKPLSISAPGTHLLYRRVHAQRSWASNLWVLPLEDGATPVNIDEGAEAKFTSDGQHILLVNVGLWMVSLDGSSRRRLTGQISSP